jgi:hypothetical protein
MQTSNYGKWEQSIEKPKDKWSEFTDGMFLAIREEELRIRREELEKHNGAHSQHCAPPDPAQRRGGCDG